MTKQTQNLGIYFSLVSQLDKLARHNRQASFRTKERYYLAMKRFCLFLADEYRLQKLANISGKHLVHYVQHLQENGRSASTIKTDLAAIRFFHDKISDPKYTLPANSELGVELERRRFGDTDRTWSNAEFNRMLEKLWRKIGTISFWLSICPDMPVFAFMNASASTLQSLNRLSGKAP